MGLSFIKITLLFLVFFSCNQEKKTYEIEAEQIPVNNSVKFNNEIQNFIKPYKNSLDKTMKEILCYSAENYIKSDGELNTAIGNMMADAVFQKSESILKKEQNLELDIVLLNHGGIRSPIPKGIIRREVAFKIMPFENEIVIAQMRGYVILDMINYLKSEKIAHPISGLNLQINKKGEIKKLLINGQILSLIHI